MKKTVGVCLGASTVSFVLVSGTENGDLNIEKHLSVKHDGDPKGTFLENLKKFNPDKLPTVVTGRKFRNIVTLDNISEPEATELAFNHIKNKDDKYDAIASLGGETFMVYTLDDESKISGVYTKNQCASGTGEFFLQQIKRMDLSVSETLDISQNAEPHKVSGRCSVFCKSDCTHALNKGTPKSEVTAGLALMIAEKIEELLKKVHGGRYLVIGGVTQNTVVMKFLREMFTQVEVPEEATYFEAFGAAIYGLKKRTKNFESFDNILVEKESSFTFLQPLSKYSDMVKYETMEKGKAHDGDRCILGLDVGSTTTKAVVIRTEDNSILGSVYLYTNGNPVRASRQCYEELLKQIPEKINIVGLGATGSGRQIAGLHALTDGVINEIVAHATAAVYFDSEVDTIFEIGGQDAKYTYIINKVPADYAMNEACSAGTGSFIEESAYESLGIKVTDIEKIAMKGQAPPNFSDQCAAFISSDIKTALQEDIRKEDIVAGLVYSICMNYVNRVKGNRQVGKKIFMQGGVSYNKAVPVAMAALTDKEIIVPPEPGLMGAFGVALEVKEKMELGFIKEKHFDLAELAARDVNYKKSFICRGGKEKCDRKCVINNIEVNGKKYPFGGACNRYYNLRYHRKDIATEEYDWVKRRQQITFEKYAPQVDLPEDAPTVGINLSFHTYTLYPLYYNFFTKLGFRVILPDDLDEDALERELTSFCFPAQISLCTFQNLLAKNPDYIWVPHLSELYVNDEEEYRIDFCSTCVFVCAEPYFLKQAFKDYQLDGRMIHPNLIMASGYDSEQDKFVESAKQMGITNEEKIREAHRFAAELQIQYQDELFEIGEDFLKFLEENPDEFAMVLVGRPYNAFTDFANKGIPRKFASRGIHVLPYDIFDYRDESVDDNMYWEGGKKILKVAKVIKRHPQLFATYVSNFSCGPDSLIVPKFRKIMGTKPSLTLELDSHSADAGINTRIDAALDIIRNYRKIQDTVKDPEDKDFVLATCSIADDWVYFNSSEGESLKITDPKIKVLIPSMGDLAAPMFAAAMRNFGINAEALPEANWDILKYARANSTGKECLPLLLLAGSLVDYMENRWDGQEYVALFNVQGGGNCRLGQYPPFLRDLIRNKRYRNVATFELMNDDGFTGLGPDFAKYAIQNLLISDVLDDVRSAIMANAVDPEEGLKVFYEEYNKVVQTMVEDQDKVFGQLERMAKRLRSDVPARIPIEESKYIALVGEIYVRRDGFSHKWLNKEFAKKGFVIKDAYIAEWIFYVDYLLQINLLEADKSLKMCYEQKIRSMFMRSAEKKIKKIMEKSGWYEYMPIEVEPLLEASKHILPLEYKGEPGITLGVSLHETLTHYCGVINIGPFGCMPTRLSEAITIPNMTVNDKINAERRRDPKYNLSEVFNGNMTIPYLSIETDGNVYPQITEARLETFTLQCERVAGLMKKAKMKNGKNGDGKFQPFKVIEKAFK